MSGRRNPSGTDYIVLQLRGPSVTSGATTVDAYQIQSRGSKWNAQSGSAPNIAVVGTYSGGAPIDVADYALQVVDESGPYATLAEAQLLPGCD